MCDSENPIDPKSLSTAFKFAALAVLLVEDPLIWRRVSPMIDITRHAVERLRQRFEISAPNPNFVFVINFLLEYPAVMHSSRKTLSDITGPAFLWMSSVVAEREEAELAATQKLRSAKISATTSPPTVPEVDESVQQESVDEDGVNDDQAALEAQLRKSGLGDFYFPLVREGLLRPSELGGLSQVEVRELGSKIGMVRFHLDRFS